MLLKEILEKYKKAIISLPLNICNEYHEDVYHVDDLKDDNQHNKIFKVGNKVFNLEINLTQNMFVMKRLCSDTIAGEVTDMDKIYLLELLSAKIFHTL